MKQTGLRQITGDVERLTDRLDTLRGTLDGVADALDRVLKRFPEAHEKLGHFWDRVYGEEDYAPAQQPARVEGGGDNEHGRPDRG